MSATSDPGAAVALALDQWLVSEFGDGVRLDGLPQPNGDGFDAEIYFVQLIGDALPRPWQAPLVLRIKPTVDGLGTARREAAVQDWVADRGFPTPRVLRVFEPGELFDRPAQLMERAPGRMLLDDLKSRPWLARRRLREMARLQVQLHETDPDGFPDGPDLLDNRLALTRSTAATLGHDGLLAGLDRVEPLLPRLRDAPGAVCHGDYHPLNVISSGDSMAVIDWTDAGVGDPAGDLARSLVLFSLAELAGSSPAERALLRFVGPRLRGVYRKGYEDHARIDRSRVDLWVPVQLLHGWSQAVGAAAGVFDEDGRTDVGARLPDGLAHELEQRFDAAVRAVT